jgi:EAL domain-containing protein (putative c-di-GMP-specific phosphodiesterase class I)
MAIPHAVIFIGKTLDLRVVAEGVEKEEQLEVLGRCGCDEFQGYLISRPMNAADTRQFIARAMSAATRQGSLAKAAGGI